MVVGATVASLRGRPGLRLAALDEAGFDFFAAPPFAAAFLGATLGVAAFLVVCFLFLLFLEVAISGNIARRNAAMAEVFVRVV